MRFRAPADRRYIARIVSKNAFHLDEAAARRVLMVQAFETGPADGKPWTAIPSFQSWRPSQPLVR